MVQLRLAVLTNQLALSVNIRSQRAKLSFIWVVKIFTSVSKISTTTVPPLLMVEEHNQLLSVMKDMVITRQRHHVFQVLLVLYVINVALDLKTAIALGLVLLCLPLANGLLILIPKTKPNSTNLSPSKPQFLTLTN